MILNSQSVQMIRVNATRLAKSIRNKDDLVDLATAANYEQVFSAIETLLTNTDMYFDDEILMQLDEENWRGFKATLLVYTLNMVNRIGTPMGASAAVQVQAEPAVQREGHGASVLSY